MNSQFLVLPPCLNCIHGQVAFMRFFFFPNNHIIGFFKFIKEFSTCLAKVRIQYTLALVMVCCFVFISVVSTVTCIVMTKIMWDVSNIKQLFLYVHESWSPESINESLSFGEETIASAYTDIFFCSVIKICRHLLRDIPA